MRKAGAAQPLTPVSIGHDDVAFLQYTGGTTGVAKGAMLLHRNIVANMLTGWRLGEALSCAKARK